MSVPAPVAAGTTVPLLDLPAQHAALAAELMPAVEAVIARQAFIMGPEVAAFEAAMAAYAGVPEAIACASGTDALLLPLRTLDLVPGDEVICPAFTFFATAGAIHNAGGTPVFADIDPVTFTLDPDAVAAAITPRTRAIIAVHLFGQMAATGALAALAARHGLLLLEDAAQAVGARRTEGGTTRAAGAAGDVGTYSFFPTKNLGGWGDGGMMVTGDAARAARLRRLRTHGGLKMYQHDEVGFNSRLDTLQAAVLLVKLRHLEAWNGARRAVAARYTAAFEGHPAVCPPRVDPANEPTWHQYTVRVEGRDALRAFLGERGIGSAVYYPTPLHLQPCFAPLGYRAGQLPVSEAASRTVLSLPIYPELGEARQALVIDAVRAFYSRSHS